MAAPEIDFSFRRYVAGRTGAAAARAREGAAYAYAGDAKVRARLDAIRPVTLAVEATLRRWQAVEKPLMLASAVKVSQAQFARVFALAARCAETLRVPVPAVYVSSAPAFVPDVGAHVLGTTDDPAIVLGGSAVDRLHDADLLATVLGRACGQIQNDHTRYLTALHFLRHADSLFVRWTAKPATLALQAWVRRADVTGDRAGLLCARDLDAALRAVAQLETDHPHPDASKRAQALRIFAETTYFRSMMAASEGAAPATAGITKEECDARVSDLFGVLG